MQNEPKEDSPRESNGKIVESKVFTESYPVTEDIRQEAGIRIAQEPFYLTEADFLRLTHNNPIVLTWANTILIASIGYGLGLLADFINKMINPKSSSPTFGEVIVFVVAIIISIFLYVVAHFQPNERKQMTAIIEKHFQTAPRRKIPLKEKK